MTKPKKERICVDSLIFFYNSTTHLILIFLSPKKENRPAARAKLYVYPRICPILKPDPPKTGPYLPKKRVFH